MPVKIADKSYLQIREVAEVLGVSRQTLQRWFREGRVKDVARDHRGWRVFTAEDVARLKQLMQRIN